MVFEAVDSTNAYLSRAVFAGDLKPASGPMAVLALAQTAGKGRSGNAWQSTNGNLALSILTLPSRPMEEWACLSLVVATSLSRVLKDRAGLDAQVKWPNDLLIDGAKLIGILPEVVRDKAGGNAGLVIGIGMNLAQAPDLLRQVNHQCCAGCGICRPSSFALGRRNLCGGLVRFDCLGRAGFCRVSRKMDGASLWCWLSSVRSATSREFRSDVPSVRRRRRFAGTGR